MTTARETHSIRPDYIVECLEPACVRVEISRVVYYGPIR